METGIIADLIVAAAADPVVVCAAIIFASLLAEDATAVVVGILVSQAVLPPLTALGALLAGTIAGDLMLHAAGRYAGNRAWGKSFLENARNARVMAALRGSGIWVVGLARFMPGMRLPVYFGSGFLRLDWRSCLAMIVITGCLWTPALFWLSLMGSDAAKHLIDEGLGVSTALAGLLITAVLLLRTCKCAMRPKRSVALETKQ